MEISYFAISCQFLSPSRVFSPFYSPLTFCIVLYSFYSQKVNIFSSTNWTLTPPWHLELLQDSI